MTVTRKILKPRPILRAAFPHDTDVPPMLLRRAIAARTCVIATYNRGRVKLAPYLLYERDDALFVDAVTIEREGRPPREPKLGAFRLSGLADLCPTIERFDPLLEVPQNEPRHQGRIVARI